MMVERTVYDRRTFRLLRENAGFFGLGSEIEMLVDGQRARVEVVYGDTLHAIGVYQRALVSGDPVRIDKANRLLPKRFQQPIVLDGK